jgi:hypothetical protein
LFWKRRHESGSGLQLGHDVTMFFTLPKGGEENLKNSFADRARRYT